MLIAGTVVLLIAVAVIVYAVATEGEYRVEESATISAPREDVFGAVLDLRKWPDWSPWLMHEPGCELTYSDSPAPDAEGGSYEWKGKRMGAGKMEHASVKAPERIEQRLTFVKPFKSVAHVTWSFEGDGDGTWVTWVMEASMPFLFRIMTPMVKRMISSDYRLGLRQLERETDPSSERFSFEFPGVSEVPAARCAYSPYSGSVEGLKKELGEVFPKLMKAAKDGDGNVPGPPMGVCRKMDVKNGRIDYEAAVPTSRESVEGFEVKEYPASTCNKVVLKGSYDLLPLAWHVAFANAGVNRLKVDKSKPPFEVYENDPESVEPSEVLTSVHIPIRT